MMRTLLSRFDVRVSLAYGVIALLWIFFSDALLAFLAGDNVTLLAAVSTAKGTGFVVVTALGLFLVLRTELRKRDRLECALQDDIAERTRTLEALQQSETRFATIFHSSPVPTSITRLDDGVAVDVNDALLKLLGYERDEVIGHTAAELGLWGDPQQRAEQAKILSGLKSMRDLTVEGRTKRGDTIFAHVSADLIQLDGVSHIVSMFHDFTEQKKLEEQIRYQALLLANASDAVLSTDMDFHIVTWNATAEAIYGWKADEVIGRRVQDVVEGEFQNTTEEAALHQAATEGAWRGEIVERHKDGRIIHILASISYITDSTGKRMGLVAVNKDITERKKMENELRASEARFRNMADTTPAMLWTTDERGLSTFLSRAWCEFTGQTEVTGLGWGWLAALHKDDREASAAAFREALNAQVPFQIEYRLLQHSTGEYRNVIAAGNPRYGDGGVFQGYTGSVVDVTERKKAQDDVQAAELLRMELEKEKELLQLKERFISVVSHEFRTPLAVIMSSAELVHGYHDRMPHERQMKHLREILVQADFMNSLLSDVLTVNKVRSNKVAFNPTPLDLVAYCDRMLERIHAVDHEQHQFVFAYDGDLANVNLDEKLLNHILVNLLSNAVKYSPNGGEVRLEIKRLNGDVELRVIDHGIGIPPESMARLFDPFYRADNIGDIGGTGLGTAIVKESVDLHHGRIDYVSELGVGTTVTVTLPTVTSVRMNGHDTP